MFDIAIVFLTGAGAASLVLAFFEYRFSIRKEQEVNVLKTKEKVGGGVGNMNLKVFNCLVKTDSSRIIVREARRGST